MPKQNTLKYLSDVTLEDIMKEADASFIHEKHSPAQPNTVSTTTRKPHSGKTVTFNILKTYGTLSNRKNAVTFALVDWGGYTRYDLRGWSADYSIPYKGISFTSEELSVLRDSLSSYVFHAYSQPKYVCDMGKTTAKIYHVISQLSSSTLRGVTWNKQVSIVDWGYGQKFDFRKWTNDYDKCGKGICLTKDEVSTLVKLLMNISL